MGFTCQWIEHAVIDGQCSRCGLALPGIKNGPYNLRVNQETGAVDMRFTGELAWAIPCMPEGER